jgi:putative oxidoreductase
MKKITILYWISTTLFSLWMLANAKAYLTNNEAKILCRHFGFPDYFRVELAIAKILGTMALIMPWPKEILKEWAYAGFTFTMISGFVAHISSGDAIYDSISALIALCLLLISYNTYHGSRRQVEGEGLVTKGT